MQPIFRHTILALLILAIATLSPGPGWAQSTLTAEEVAKLRLLLQYIRIDNNELNGLAGPHVIIEGVNVHVRSGSGVTDDGGEPSGWGNLIIGYNEVALPEDMPDPAGSHRGSHNLVIGQWHTYTSVGGLVAGLQNTVLAPFASVSGGKLNSARGTAASVSGGQSNRAQVSRRVSVAALSMRLVLASAASVAVHITRLKASMPASVAGRTIPPAATMPVSLALLRAM
jgi:hypothetical protein